MSFPWLFVENFANGTRGNFDATSGTAITFPHYSELARFSMTPFRGAYGCKIALTGGTTSQFVREDTGFDTSAAGTIFFKIAFYLGKDITMADADKFSLVELESVLNTTTEVAAGIQRNGSNIEAWFNETAAAASPTTMVLGTTTTALGRWYQIEIQALIDSGAPNDGTIDGWIDDVSMGAQIASLDQGAIVDAKVGVIGPDAGTSGTVLIGNVIADDARIGRERERYRSSNVWIATADHPIIGPGTFTAAVTGTGTNAELLCYDTDGALTPGISTAPTGTHTPILHLRNTVANEFVPGHTEFHVNHGLFCVLAGTSPQGFIQIKNAAFTSDATIISRGLSLGRPSPGGY